MTLSDFVNWKNIGFFDILAYLVSLYVFITFVYLFISRWFSEFNYSFKLRNFTSELSFSPEVPFFSFLKFLKFHLMSCFNFKIDPYFQLWQHIFCLYILLCYFVRIFDILISKMNFNFIEYINSFLPYRTFAIYDSDNFTNGYIDYLNLLYVFGPLELIVKFLMLITLIWITFRYLVSYDLMEKEDYEGGYITNKGLGFGKKRFFIIPLIILALIIWFNNYLEYIIVTQITLPITFLFFVFIFAKYINYIDRWNVIFFFEEHRGYALDAEIANEGENLSKKNTMKYYRAFYEKIMKEK